MLLKSEPFCKWACNRLQLLAAPAINEASGALVDLAKIQGVNKPPCGYKFVGGRKLLM
jgi:hypothetical protein